MKRTPRHALRDVMRRVAEVRGLAPDAEGLVATEPATPAALLGTVEELTEELELSHRRLIETHVQLLALREVASSLVAAHDPGETTRAVTTFLCRAFGFDHGFLLLVDRETGHLEGTWTHLESGRRRSHTLSVPLIGDHGAVTRALWLDRTVVHHAPAPHVSVALPEGHALTDALEGLAGCVCVPLRRGHPTSGIGSGRDGCAERCPLGSADLLAPPPGEAAQSWASDREDRQRHCLDCPVFPSLGVIGVARRSGAPLHSSDVARLESIALSIAPMVENARLAQDLRRSERFRQHVLDSMGSALVAVNLRGEILTINRAAEELLGVTAADVRGVPFGVRFGTNAVPPLRDALEEGRETARLDTVLRTAGGGEAPVRMATSLLRDERRVVYGAIATFADLTAIRRAEEQAQRTDRLAALGRFTSSVAHEIRNPLTGIGAGIQYLERSVGGDAAQRENLEFILREIRRLDRIVQDLFDVTHPRGLELRAAPVDDAVRRAAQCLEPLLEERGVPLELDLAPRTLAIRHDGDQLEQVILNLIKNAAEASPRGALLRVEVRPVTGEGGSPAGVAIRVIDSGCGIPPDHLKTIFEPFFTTKPGGSGLGLYLSHDIVKRHGGTLTVSSEPGRGTTFTVEIPAEADGGSR